jgi:hypothetical protein
MAGGAIFGYSSAQLVLSGPEFCNNSVVSAVWHWPASPGIDRCVALSVMKEVEDEIHLRIIGCWSCINGDPED